MKSSRLSLALLSLIVAAAAFLPATSRADTASLYLTPANLSRPTGSNFTINVGVNSGGNSINAIQATVNIPSVLSITGTSTGGSLCSIWVQQPTVSGSSVSFKCGVPGGTTANGNLISISLRANTVGSGSGSASITGARVLAGPGQDVTGGTTGGSYTVTATTSSAKSGGGTPAPTLPDAPTITSNTHPDQNKWYTDANPTFNWTRGGNIIATSYVFDQTADTVPSTTANPVYATSATFVNQTDGVWYFHIRANSSTGWSSTNTYRVQIDRTAPTGLTVITEPKQVADKRPMVSFAAVDAASGVDHYELRLDDNPFKLAASPYTPDSITSGEHTFTVRAYDKAGNFTESAAKITIKTIPVPKITTPKANTTLKLVQQLQIGGTASPSTLIDIYIDDVKVASAITVASDGTWSYTHKAVLMPGKHHLTARAVKDGIQSQLSAPVTITIDPSAVSLLGQNISIYVVIAALLVLLGLLGLLVVWLFIASRRQYRKIRDRFIKQNQQVEAKVENYLDDMKTTIRRDVQHEVPATDTTNKQRLTKKIDTDIAATKKAVGSEIERGSKEL